MTDEPPRLAIARARALFAPRRVERELDEELAFHLERETQKLVDRSIVLVDPVDAIARLQLARALVLSGDTGKARSTYNDVLTRWKNADSEIPIVELARAEYARLP